MKSDTFDSLFPQLLTYCLICLHINEHTHTPLLKGATWRAALPHHCDIEFGLKDDTFVNYLDADHG